MCSSDLVYDVDGSFEKRCNTSMVDLHPLLPEDQQLAQTGGALHLGQSDEAHLRRLLESHHKWTGSQRASELLDDWDNALKRFVKVFPKEYQRALRERAQAGTVHAADTTSMQTAQPGNPVAAQGTLTK